MIYFTARSWFAYSEVREFLPLSCFGERDLLKLSSNTHNMSYEDFLEGRESADGTKGYVKRGQPLKIILRNRDEKADRLLDLLVRVPYITTWVYI